jgi:hypothetical protein
VHASFRAPHSYSRQAEWLPSVSIRDKPIARLLPEHYVFSDQNEKKLDDIPDIIRKSVTELLNNIRDIAQYVDQFKVTFLREAADLINIPIVTSQPNNLYEDVSGTGTCIPASYLDNFDSVYDQLIKIRNRETTDEARNNTKDIFFLKLSKHIDKVVAMKENKNRNRNRNRNKNRNRNRNKNSDRDKDGHGHGHKSENENENENEIENGNENEIKNKIEDEYGAEEALQITNIMMACHTNMIHKVLQIKQYDWMSLQSFHASKERIRSLGIRQYDRTKITSSKSEYLVNGIIEIPQQDISKLREKYTFDERHLERIHDIHGYIDCVCEDTLS